MISQLLLAVLVTAMFGLIFLIGKTFLSSLTEYVLAFLVEHRRHRLRLWPSGLIIVTALVVTICLWALVTGNLSVNYVIYVAIGFAAVAVLCAQASRHRHADTSMTSGKAIKLFSADTRRQSLYGGRFSVITRSLAAFALVASIALAALLTSTVTASAGDAGLLADSSSGTAFFVIGGFLLLGVALAATLFGYRRRI